MGNPNATPTSPWTWTTTDPTMKTLSATVVFNTASPFSLTSVTMNRQAGCIFQHIYFGLGSDGTPDATITQFSVATGTTKVNSGTLNNFGFTTFTNVIAGQITAGA